MRMLILPAALLLGAALYSLLPALGDRLCGGLRALLRQVQRVFTTKRGRTDGRSALAVYLLAFAAAATLVSAIHPLFSALAMAPLFAGFSVLPQATAAKLDLDSGVYAKDAPAYERRVMDACRPLGGAFARGIAAPLLLCALGLALRMGGALAWVFAGLRAVREEAPAGEKALLAIERAGDTAMVILLRLCAGLVGRSPLCIGGQGAGEKLMHILSLEGETDHAPIAGDITQGVFLCCLCAGLLCALLTALGIPFA